MRWVVRSILHGGPIEPYLFSSQCSTSGVTKAVVCAIHVCGMVHIKDPLLLIGKTLAHDAAAGFVSCYLNCPLPHD